MKTLFYANMTCVLLVCSGCATGSTIATARGKTAKDDKGNVVVIEKPAPGVYALMPFAVAFDVATFPIWGLVAWQAAHMASAFP